MARHRAYYSKRKLVPSRTLGKGWTSRCIWTGSGTWACGQIYRTPGSEPDLVELNYGSWVTRACATPPVDVNRDLLASVSGTGAFGVGSSFVECSRQNFKLQ